MPKGIPLSEEEQCARRHEIFEAAAGLILKNGFQETSMRQIAEAAGLGKSTLYDYFQTKDEILLFVIEEKSSVLHRKAQSIACLELPALDRLLKVIEMHVDFMQENKNLFLRLMVEAQRLKIDSQKRIQNMRYEYQDLVRNMIDEGIMDKSFRKVDSLLTARLLIHSIAAILFTTRPTGDIQSMQKELMGIFLEGIQA